MNFVIVIVQCARDQRRRLRLVALKRKLISRNEVVLSREPHSADCLAEVKLCTGADAEHLDKSCEDPDSNQWDNSHVAETIVYLAGISRAVYLQVYGTPEQAVVGGFSLK